MDGFTQNDLDAIAEQERLAEAPIDETEHICGWRLSSGAAILPSECAACERGER